MLDYSRARQAPPTASFERIIRRITNLVGIIKDVFGGEHFCNLCKPSVDKGGVYRFLANPEDIALDLSTDRYPLFK
jgi:hypothetical protein